LTQSTRTPGDQQHAKDTLEYYQWLAKLAEKGKISCIFFADVYGVDCLYENDARAAFETAAGAGSMDPMVLVAGMASVTKNVSFGITGSTTYLNVKKKKKYYPEGNFIGTDSIL
jgi:alkanesulfonate monooxygenase SsuD/methylene tetrahydromethanopterin reductase-like flavin-dependent oxidoreductase (luciferase family)